MSVQDPPRNLEEDDQNVDPKNKNKDNDNSNSPKTEPSKLDYDRDWSTINRKKGRKQYNGYAVFVSSPKMQMTN